MKKNLVLPLVFMVSSLFSHFAVSENLPFCKDQQLDLQNSPAGFRCVTSGADLGGWDLNEDRLKYERSVFSRVRSGSGDWGWLDEKQGLIFYDRFVPHNGSNANGTMSAVEMEAFVSRDRGGERRAYADSHGQIEMCRLGQRLPSPREYERAEAHGIKEVLGDIKESIFWTTNTDYTFTGEFALTWMPSRQYFKRIARFTKFPRRTSLPVATRCVSEGQ